MTTSLTRIDADTLDRWLRQRDDVRVLDVRTPAEFGSVHIPGAYNVPLDTLNEHAREIQRHVEETVVVVCRSGARAAQAEQRLASVGMGNVKVLDGGMLAWEKGSGARPVNRGKARWDIERQVRLVAGSLVAGGIVVSVWVPAARYLSGAVGAGLSIAALTNSCLMGSLLAKLPYNRGEGCDIDAVVAELIGSRAASVASAGS